MKEPLFNNQIIAERVRLIDEEGKQLGIFSLEEALKIAKERNLDLIQVTEKTDPPVCKIGDYGKYLYWLQKKEKGQKKGSQIKGLRLTLNISAHDLETKIRQAEGFLKKGDKVKIEMILRGREKIFQNLIEEKINNFLSNLNKLIAIKTEGNLKKEKNRVVILVSKK